MAKILDGGHAVVVPPAGTTLKTIRKTISTVDLQALPTGDKFWMAIHFTDGTSKSFSFDPRRRYDPDVSNALEKGTFEIWTAKKGKTKLYTAEAWEASVAQA